MSDDALLNPQTLTALSYNLRQFGMDEQESSQINMTSLTLLSFELEVIQEWIDPFDSPALKILTGVAYTVGVLASIPILAFVVYETGGYAGHFRTVINQLLSFIYGVVRIFFKDDLARELTVNKL